jgi:GxxExxY protein
MSDITNFPDLGARITQKIIKAGIEVHRELGPGLLESVYEICLEIEFKKAGLFYERQKKIPVYYKGYKLDHCFKADFIVENKVIIELKTVEALLPLHHAQLMSYMKMKGLELGLLMNFNSPLLKDGIKRIALSQNREDR